MQRIAATIADHLKKIATKGRSYLGASAGQTTTKWNPWQRLQGEQGPGQWVHSTKMLKAWARRAWPQPQASDQLLAAVAGVRALCRELPSHSDIAQQRRGDDPSNASTAAVIVSGPETERATDLEVFAAIERPIHSVTDRCVFSCRIVIVSESLSP